MASLWVGVDAGKTKQHCVLLEAEGKALQRQAVENDECAPLDLYANGLMLASDASGRWALDLNTGGPALLVALLSARAHDLPHIPGRIIHPAAATYRGDGKTDAKDARIIAHHARIRNDRHPVRGPDQVSVELPLLTSQRLDLIDDRVRAINPLRTTLLECTPAPEAAIDYSKHRAALMILPKYTTPGALRRLGRARLTRWLETRES